MRMSSRAWLTSFGDLLTLLLCFFVITVYQSARVTTQKNKEIQRVEHENSILVQSPGSDGKAIASNKVTEFKHSILRLSKAGFKSSYAGLSDFGAAQVEKFLERTEGQLDVGICNVGFDYSETVFESLEGKLAPRGAKFLMGSKVCKDLNISANGSGEEIIFLSAGLKQSHG